jgi:hypothetical protein
LSKGEARGDCKEVVHPVLRAGGALEELLDIIVDRDEEAATTTEAI